MKQIILGGKRATKAGAIALVDDADFELASQHSWSLHHSGYVQSQIRVDGKQKHITLHRFLMGFPDSDVDHADGDSPNNQRGNLRLATSHQNGANSKPRLGGTSKFKGVCFDKQKQSWLARITKNRKVRNLGHYKSEEDAAHWYDIYAIGLFKDFARLNFTAPLVITFRCTKELAHVAA